MLFIRHILGIYWNKFFVYDFNYASKFVWQKSYCDMFDNFTRENQKAFRLILYSPKWSANK